jgi:ubiquinone/menaquinone biosynthesis C-methylase UbiE
MATSNNALATPEPWTLVSKGYEQTTMEFLAQYAHTAIGMSVLNNNSNVLDLACGPGTLTRIIHNKVKSVVALDFSAHMVELLNNYLNCEKISNVTTMTADGQNLSFRQNEFDLVFSMFGLMFFPDRLQGFSECFRVLKPGGQIIVSSWAPIAQSPAMTMMFGALRAAKPDLPAPQENINSLENQATFKHELQQAGFTNISVKRVTHAIDVSSARGFWNEMIKGSAPIAMLKQSIADDALWDSMQKTALSYLDNALPEVPTSLSSDAWVGIASKP